MEIVVYLLLQISIHVPAWGTTVFFRPDLSALSISIHVPAWGTTPVLNQYRISLEISIHVPAWGTTFCSSSEPLFPVQFQSTFPRGERQIDTVTIRK